jgi:hypothetical protein
MYKIYLWESWFGGWVGRKEEGGGNCCNEKGQNRDRGPKWPCPFPLQLQYNIVHILPPKLMPKKVSMSIPNIFMMTQFPLSQSFSLLPSKFIKMNDLIIQIFS